MSGFQALEPQPTAEVILHTTAGDIRLELFAKQIPLASRNFLQLCLDGYYNNTVFHRLVPGFIIQGGDPTGTGSGGESSFDDGAPFEDEFHSRLKFNRRGLLGMANSGRKNDNGSQFFLTLGETPELTGKNTMFGRIEGETIYNLMKMTEAELVEGTERPLYPAKVTGAEIVINPFEDMVKRVTEAPRTAPVKEAQKRKPKRKAGKNVLSFGGDEEEDRMDMAPATKKPKFNPTLVSAGKADPKALNNPPMPKGPSKRDDRPAIEAKVPVKDSKTPQALPERLSRAVPARGAKSPSPTPSDSSEEPEEKDTKSKALLDQTNEEIAKLKASMKRIAPTAPSTITKPKTGLEAFIPTTATRGRKRRPGGNSTAEDRSLDMLNAFRAKLDTVPDETASSPVKDIKMTNGDAHKQNGHSEPAPKPAADDEEAKICDLHFIANCQSCSKWDDADNAADDDDADQGWMSHALSFAKDRLGKDLEWKRKNEEELVVIDPREKANNIKEDRKKDRDRDREREKEKGKSERGR